MSQATKNLWAGPTPKLRACELVACVCQPVSVSLVAWGKEHVPATIQAMF
jgi:hypothetical protein